MNTSMKARLAALAAIGMMMDSGPSIGKGLDLSPEDFEKQTAKSAERHKENLKAKGVQESTIDGVTVIARNRKNAERKVRNILNAKK
jgi:hypothetical protein